MKELSEAEFRDWIDRSNMEIVDEFEVQNKLTVIYKPIRGESLFVTGEKHKWVRNILLESASEKDKPDRLDKVKEKAKDK